jgi:hypothetical protein
MGDRGEKPLTELEPKPDMCGSLKSLSQQQRPLPALDPIVLKPVNEQVVVVSDQRIRGSHISGIWDARTECLSVQM